jgi:hypothetical protein
MPFVRAAHPARLGAWVDRSDPVKPTPIVKAADTQSLPEPCELLQKVRARATSVALSPPALPMRAQSL